MNNYKSVLIFAWGLMCFKADSYAVDFSDFNVLKNKSLLDACDTYYAQHNEFEDDDEDDDWDCDQDDRPRHFLSLQLMLSHFSAN